MVSGSLNISANGDCEHKVTSFGKHLLPARSEQMRDDNKMLMAGTFMLGFCQKVQQQCLQQQVEESTHNGSVVGLCHTSLWERAKGAKRPDTDSVPNLKEWVPIVKHQGAMAQKLKYPDQP
jgi:hypothetical protein